MFKKLRQIMNYRQPEEAAPQQSSLKPDLPEGWVDVGARKCPACSGKIDVGKIIHGHGSGPREGDIGICHHCGVILEYSGKELKVCSEAAWEKCSPSLKQLALHLSTHATNHSGASSPKSSLRKEIEELFGSDGGTE